MKKRARWIAAAAGIALVWGLGVPRAEARSEPRTYNVKGNSAKEAGIGSYRIEMVGPDLVQVAVFDGEGADLADCEVEWIERKTVAACELAQGGHYRWAADKETRTLLFEDLSTRESATAHFGFDERTPEEKLRRIPNDEIPPLEEIVITGDKTAEELERDWGEVGRLVGAIANEVMWTLDRQLSQGGGPGAGAPPSGVDGYCDLSTSRWDCTLEAGASKSISWVIVAATPWG